MALSMSTAALAGFTVFKKPAVLWMNGGDSTSTSPLIAAERINRVAGPGRPLTACLMAI